MYLILALKLTAMMLLSVNSLASAVDKKYRMIGEPNNLMCFASEPTTVLTNVRSLLECSTKCNHAIFCNAFNYISNNGLVPYCQLFYYKNEEQYRNVSNANTNCIAYEDIEQREGLNIADYYSTAAPTSTTSIPTTASTPQATTTTPIETTSEAITMATNENPTTVCLPSGLSGLKMIDSQECNFPFTMNGGLFYSCSNKLPGMVQSCADYFCIVGDRGVAQCRNPFDFSATNTTILIKESADNDVTVPVISVNGWIVFQQRIDGTLGFDKNWADYKAGFGTPDSNFWLGLGKISYLTGSGVYRLRFEVLVNGNWMSDEYNTFKIDGESNFYAIYVDGYIGDNCNIMNHLGDDGVSVQNGAKFSTVDYNDQYGYASATRSGNWFGVYFAQNVNGVYGSTATYYISSAGRHLIITHCRMMMKSNPTTSDASMST